MMHPHDHPHRIAEGIIGTVTPIVGLITSLQEQIEYWFRITSLAIGIMVGLVTLYRLVTRK